MGYEARSNGNVAALRQANGSFSRRCHARIRLSSYMFHGHQASCRRYVHEGDAKHRIVLLWLTGYESGRKVRALPTNSVLAGLVAGISYY